LLVVALAVCLGAAPPKKKTWSKARIAATKRAAELTASLAKQKVSGFVVAGRPAFPSKETARASKVAPTGGVAIDASSVFGGAHGNLWKVISDQGDVVEVQSIHGGERGDCQLPSANAPIEARAFVRRIDLRPVLVTEVSQRFSDGTAISFAPGAALGAPILARRSGWAVHADRLTFELKVPDEAIALSFAAPKPFSFATKRLSGKPGPDGRWSEEPWRQVVPASVLYLDGRAALRADMLSDDMNEVQTTEGSSRPQEELLGLVSKCVRLKVIGNSEDGEDNGSSGSSGRLEAPSGRFTHRIPKDTALTYPDGSPAGRTLDDVFGWEPTLDNGRVCLGLAIAIESRFCAPASAAIEVK
jgi:hypothetical protein